MEDRATEDNKLKSPEIIELISDRLQELRKRLLDASRRNPLVNIPFRANSTNILRIVDELPDILRFNLTNATAMRLAPLPALEDELPDEYTSEYLSALRLAQNENGDYRRELDELDPDKKDFEQKVMLLERELKDQVRFALGLPERHTKDSPSLAEHARAHGISPDYALPQPKAEHEDDRHKCTDIQTLMLAEKLSRLAKGLLEKARAFERETGVNVLHVAFGLLEWRSPGEKEKYISPLALLEIRLERKQSPQGAQFHLVGEGGVLVNTTLKQKLFTEYRLDLPEYKSGSIEDYFVEVAKSAPSGWHWNVRREVVIGIFPSSKIAMYHDLDPEKRPVAENPIVGRLLATTGSGEAAYAPVYGTDAPEIARKVPYLVMDADASQFSALVDIANGQHVSIEGPPGSGKSQTIVNLVAAALASQKRVLFVAEKLTALDVVKNRLEAAGLGEFILPLQAGRGTRDQVYHSLDERLSVEDADGRAHRSFSSRQNILEVRRQVLQNYLDALGSDFGTSGFSVYDVIGYGIATNEAREEVPKEVRRIAVPSCDELGEARIEALLSDVEAFAGRLGQIHRMPAIWIDARAVILNRDEAEDVCESLSKLADQMERFEHEASRSQAKSLFTDGVFSTDIAISKDLLSAITENEGRIDPDLVETLTNSIHRRLVQDICGQIQEHRTAIAHLGRRLADPEGPGLTEQLRAAQRFASRADGRIDPDAISARVARMETDIEAMRRQVLIAEALPARWAANSTRTLNEIHVYASRLMATPKIVLVHRRGNPDRNAEHMAASLKVTHAKLSMELNLIQQALPKAGEHSAAQIAEVADTIESAGVMRFLSSAYKTACDTYTKELGGSPKDNRETIARLLGKYSEWLKKAFSFNQEKKFLEAFGSLFLGIKTDLSIIDSMVALHATCVEISGSDDDLLSALETGDLATISAFCAETEWPKASLADLRACIEENNRRLIAERSRQDEAWTYLEMFQGARSIESTEISELLGQQERVGELAALINESETASLIGGRFRGVNTKTDVLSMECTLARKLSEAPDPALAISVLRSGKANEVIRALAALSGSRAQIEDDVAELSRILDFEPETGTVAALSLRLSELRAAASDPSSLMERARLRKSEKTLREQGFGKLVDWVLAKGESLDPKRLGPIVRAIVAKSMVDRAYQIHGDALQGYDGEAYDRIRAEIVEKDRELIVMSRDVVRSHLIANAKPPAGSGIGKKSTYTDMSLIRNEMGKRRNRIGVRELTTRAGEALLELKPCWIMSPLAVAQYLHSGLTFDLVVIDEASQMTPENAVGAMSRARQAVVVGDTKQLPPTSFFRKMVDDTDTDEDLREDSESVLDMANMAFRPVRQLRWHYRSRHSALIQFSNTWMYDKKLTIFPSAREDDPELGVHLKEVEGIYRGGTNEVEARKVVEAVVAHMRDCPDLSLGVCTMNINQKDLIREEFERELERNLHVQDYVRDWQEREDALEEFFVKNLETIQGDERDVMFISTLYGPENSGARVHQRFGPINSVHGHRRLNVLFTRAKRKIVTFASLKPTDILAGEEKARGVQMFRAWLEYCASGHVPDKAGAGGKTESPFEDYVVAQIEAMGCEAVPQVGAAGYRIDIGVRHPNWPYGYLLGVECDGASYHSSKSSRDRDRLRQEVLEGLGWRFHRIWSTDWFNDPRSQIARLRDAIDAAFETVKSQPVSIRPVVKDVGVVPKRLESSTEIKNMRPTEISKYNQRDLFGLDMEKMAPLTQANETNDQDKSGILVPGLIRLGSTVKIENLSDKGRKLAFTIVKDGNDLKAGKLGMYTPLGQALIDAQEGDKVEYQVGVEIKEIRILKVS